MSDEKKTVEINADYSVESGWMDDIPAEHRYLVAILGCAVSQCLIHGEISFEGASDAVAKLGAIFRIPEPKRIPGKSEHDREIETIVKDARKKERVFS